MTDYYDQLKPAIDVLAMLIKKYKKIENIEIEIRIGRIDKKTFEPGLNSTEFFSKILKTLYTCDKWKNISEHSTDEYIKDDCKTIIDKKTNNKVSIRKTKLESYNFSFVNTPYDFRISVSKEEKITSQVTKHQIIRKKNRVSFHYKECNFDITQVEEETENEIIENEEFEIELTNLDSNTSDVYRAHSALLKIRDIINICEPIIDRARIEIK